MILTGAQALNKMLGREVYTSNLQLGGTQIMARNGTSHLVADSDLDAALKAIQWLAYVPERKGKAIPISPSQDTWDRPVTYAPPKGPYDPRWLLQGKEDEGLTGLFDKGSFFETLAEWAKTIVTGRARLGGIPVGVIAVETRTTERIVPADPANASGFEQKVMEAGQVWTPNSAYKTAQSIYDINREGLPLVILANIRGFSGGQQDMVRCPPIEFSVSTSSDPPPSSLLSTTRSSSKDPRSLTASRSSSSPSSSTSFPTESS